MKAKYSRFGFTPIKIIYIICAVIVNIALINSAYSNNLYDKAVSGFYQHYDGEGKLNIKLDGTFTIVVRSTNTVITGSWKENDKFEIIFTFPHSANLNRYQIYGGHLFQNGYLVWRKHN